MALAQLVRRLDPSAILGVDPRPDARSWAAKAGCTETFHPDDLPEFYRAGERARQEWRADVVLEAAGVTSALEVAPQLVKPHGVLGVIGYHSSGTAKMDMDLWYKGVTIVNGFSPRTARVMAAMAEGLELLATGSSPTCPSSHIGSVWKAWTSPSA